MDWTMTDLTRCPFVILDSISKSSIEIPETNSQKFANFDLSVQAFMIFDINLQTSETGFSRIARIILIIVGITSP